MIRISKINYNLATNKKVDIKKSGLYWSGLLILSLVFLVFGINTLSIRDKQMRSDKSKLNFYNKRLSDMAQKTTLYERDVKKIGFAWRDKVKFANTLISRKVFDLQGKLNVLEEILPLGVYIKDLFIKVQPGSSVQVTVVADSYESLFETYKRFSPFDPAIKSENESEGIFHARISLNMKSDASHEKD